MSGIVQCFWMEPTEFCEVQLRRFTFEKDKKCRSSSYGGGHNASIVILEKALRSAWIEDAPEGYERNRDDLVSQEDPRWPATCDQCGEPFQVDDDWQVNCYTLYSGAPDGKLYPHRRAPAGAMWNARWWPADNPDGITLMVMLPDGCDWMVDDGRWTRTGDPRKPETLTVRASIRSPRYHGFLTEGRLEPCGDSQT
ncbi:MAG: hypothetical protein ACJ8AK_02965 [Gemmatimonadaceae bacterium]